jgi:YHS domain-containing protein
MTVNSTTSKYKSEFRGDLYYFCCIDCKQTFDKQPDKYILAEAR